jgi:hypothetical protein
LQKKKKLNSEDNWFQTSAWDDESFELLIEVMKKEFSVDMLETSIPLSKLAAKIRGDPGNQRHVTAFADLSGKDIFSS